VAATAEADQEDFKRNVHPFDGDGLLAAAGNHSFYLSLSLNSRSKLELILIPLPSYVEASKLLALTHPLSLSLSLFLSSCL
jgi:hypothetical protein